MCALLRYSAGGFAALLTTAYVAVSAETGSSAFRPSVAEPARLGESVVNRATKGNREATLRDMRVPVQNLPGTSVEKKKPPALPKERKILEGCDPAFSPLTASAKNNFASRCLV